jgi:hypothetical protein
MLVRRYGTTVQSVETNFDARAMTEVGFRRSGELSLAAAEFNDQYERVRGVELTAAAEGHVQGEAEEALLASLKEQLDQVLAELGDGELLLVESEAGTNYPKTRERTTTQVVSGQNRLYFEWTVDPPLKLGVYRRREG